MPKRIQTQEKWKAILNQFYSSNKSARQWCQENSVSYQSLLHWKNKFKPKNSFIELKQEDPLELSWNGIKLTFSSFEKLKEFKRLLETLC